MLSRVIVNIMRRSVFNARMLCCKRDCLQSDFFICESGANQYSVQNHCNPYVIKRFKSSRKKAADIKKTRDEESDEEKEEANEEEASIGSKLLKIKVPSTRLDTISKTGFGMSRNKVEEAFYASRFRINGNKVLKKSKKVEIGDEIDIVLHQSVDSPGFLVVNRIVILSVDSVGDSIQIKLSIDKDLLIEDYEDPYI